MSTFGERLRSERKRLGLSQDNVAAFCKIHRKTQVNYELDRGRPTPDYVQALASLGFDVNFVGGGVRASDVDNYTATQLRLLSYLLQSLGYPDVERLLQRAFQREAAEVQTARGDGQVSGDSKLLVSSRGTLREAAELVRDSPIVAELLAAARELDPALLGAAVAAVDQALAARRATLSPEKKGLLIAALYRNAWKQGRVDSKMAADAVALAI